MELCRGEIRVLKPSIFKKTTEGNITLIKSRMIGAEALNSFNVGLVWFSMVCMFWEPAISFQIYKAAHTKARTNTYDIMNPNLLEKSPL